jgi:hypothetical protein
MLQGKIKEIAAGSNYLFPAVFSGGCGGEENMYTYEHDFNYDSDNKVRIGKKEIEGKIYFYKDWGSEVHGKTSFRLWINRKLVKFDEEGEPYIEFPCVNAKIMRTEKGNLVLRGCEGWVVFRVGVICGYRGESYFEILDPKDCEIFEYKKFSSPIGSLGISRYALVNVPCSGLDTTLKVKYSRTGRLYGEPSEWITIYYLNGTKDEILGIQDGLEALKELEELTQE